MKKNLTLIIVIALIAVSIYYLEGQKPDISGEVVNSDIAVGETSNQANSMTIEEKAKQYERAKEIVQPGQFFNTKNNQPITIKELIGNKIVMVDFWTYSCINCQRTLPYLNAWYDKYADDGLVILGLHAPEFDFEKDPENVQDAIDRFGIEYPVIQDNEFGTWRAYKNRYWPRKYIIDIDGFIVYDHIGEGAYDETERVIQELLQEKAERIQQEVQFEAGQLTDPEGKSSASSRMISPEVYFGAWRNEYLVNAEKNKIGEQTIDELKPPEGNELQLIGTWDIAEKHATNLSEGAKIQFAYRARDVFMVLAAEGEPVRAQVFVDGAVISSEMAGDDVDENGYITVKEEQLYKVIKNGDNAKFQNLELRIESPGLQAFTFTFG